MGWAGTVSCSGGRLAQPLQHGAGRDIPRAWGSTTSKEGQGQWHTPQGQHMSCLFLPPASPLRPKVFRRSIYQTGVAQSPVVLAWSNKRRAGGASSSSTVAKAYPESGKWVWISFCQPSPAQHCWNKSERTVAAIQSGQWALGLCWSVLQHCSGFIWGHLHPKCM